MPESAMGSRYRLLVSVAFLYLILLATACGGSGGKEHAASTPTAALAVPTAAASPTRDPFVVPGKEAQATVIAETFARSLTATARTPEPTLPPLDFAEPTPTWALGLFDCGLPGNPYEPQLNTCWRGTVTGKLMALAAGHEGDMGDRAQGVLLVSDGPDISGAPFIVYRTPQVVGAVRITAIQSTPVFLQATDSQTTFMFDLASRAWVPPGTLPTPTVR